MAASASLVDHREYLGSAGLAKVTPRSGKLESINRHHAHSCMATPMASPDEGQTRASVCSHPP